MASTRNWAFIILTMLGASPSIRASTIYTARQQVSNYEDTQGLNRNRFLLDITAKNSREGRLLTNTSYTLVASRDYYENSNLQDDDYTQKYYKSDKRTNDSVTLSTSQTWNRLTDSRVLISSASDGVVSSRTGGIGLSQWMWHETLQVGVDISRTLVERPYFEILDETSDIVTPPSNVQATGVTLSAKNLATPTTVISYAVAHLETNDRPPSNTYIVGLRQFIPKTKSAIHTNIARAINRGRVTTNTSYGEVDAWIAELSFLQNLWKGGTTRLGYRYYKEDEVTRVKRNEYVRGSDTISLNLAQEVRNMSIEAGAMRYATNELDTGGKVAANIYEAALMVRF